MLPIIVMFILMSCSAPQNEEIQSKEIEGEVKLENGEQPQESQQEMPQTSILSISSNLETKDGWLIVTENTTEVILTVEAELADTVLCWIAPTGTETGKERELIGYDVDGSDGWTIRFQAGDRMYHDHILIQALGVDGVSMASTSLNIHSEMDTDYTE